MPAIAEDQIERQREQRQDGDFCQDQMLAGKEIVVDAKCRNPKEHLERTPMPPGCEPSFELVRRRRHHRTLPRENRPSWTRQ